MKNSILILTGVLALSLAFADDSKPGDLEVKDAPVEQAVEEATPRKGTKKVSGVVNVLRQGSRVEVVMRGGEVFYLPTGSRQPAIFKALSESERTGKAVSFTVHEKSGVIEEVGSSSGSSGGTSK